MAESLTLHHVGVLVHDMQEAQSFYRELGATVGEAITIESQGVRVCFVEMAGDVAIELVEPSQNGLAAGLLKRGFSYYHVGYLVADIDEAVRRFAARNFMLFEKFQSEAFAGRWCAFLMSPLRHLVEIIEQEEYGLDQYGNGAPASVRKPL